MSTSTTPTREGAPAEDWRSRLSGSRAGTLGVLVLTTLLVLAGVWFVQKPGADDKVTAVQVSGAASGPAPAVGAPAQDFTARTVDGREVKLSQFRGKPVWLLFGATWCASCRAEVADVQAAYEKAKASGVEVLSVYLSEDTATVADYTDKTRLSYLHIPDPKTDIASSYRVLGIPAHYFIDEDGTISSIQVGALDRSTMDSTLAALAR